MKIELYSFVGLLLIAGLTSCQKKDYDDSFTAFAPVYFDNNSVLLLDLGVKYKGSPIDWDQGNGKINVPVGEATFEFYDKRNGTVLAEKKVDVNATNPDTFLIFQPLEEAPLAFIDPKAEEKEAAAPNGFMKIKIANYVPQFLPFEKTDVVLNFRYQQGRQYLYAPVDTMEMVGRNLDTAVYRLAQRGTPQTGNETYFLTFMDHATGEYIKNAGGNTYASHVAITPDGKNVFTLFLTPVKIDFSNNLYLIKGDEYYYIEPRPVFQ